MSEEEPVLIISFKGNLNKTKKAWKRLIGRGIKISDRELSEIDNPAKKEVEYIFYPLKKQPDSPEYMKCFEFKKFDDTDYFSYIMGVDSEKPEKVEVPFVAFKGNLKRFEKAVKNLVGKGILEKDLKNGLSEFKKTGYDMGNLYKFEPKRLEIPFIFHKGSSKKLKEFCERVVGKGIPMSDFEHSKIDLNEKYEEPFTSYFKNSRINKKEDDLFTYSRKFEKEDFFIKYRNKLDSFESFKLEKYDLEEYFGLRKPEKKNKKLDRDDREFMGYA